MSKRTKASCNPEAEQSPLLVLGDCLDVFQNEIRNIQLPAEPHKLIIDRIGRYSLRLHWLLLCGNYDDVILWLEFHKHAAIAQRLERDIEELKKEVRQADEFCIKYSRATVKSTDDHEAFFDELDYLRQTLAGTVSCIADYLRKVDKMIAVANDAKASGIHAGNDPYFPAKYYSDRYNISDDTLRKAAHDGKIKKRKGNGRLNHYRDAEVRRLWPQEFFKVEHDSP